MSRGKHWSDAEWDELERLQAQGLDYKEIARRMGRSGTAVYERTRPKTERKPYMTHPRDGQNIVRIRTADADRMAGPPRQQPYDPVRDNLRLAKILRGTR